MGRITWLFAGLAAVICALLLVQPGAAQIVVNPGSGGGGTPGGSDTQVQFNDGGAFGGSANLTWDDAKLYALAMKTPTMSFAADAGGTYTLAASGIVWKNASGVEIGRIWMTDPDDANYNSGNLYIGKDAGLNQPTNNVDAGYYNIGLGYEVMASITTGVSNSAVGTWGLFSLTEGNNNTAVGETAGYYITTGDLNVVAGDCGGCWIITGNDNVAIGNQSSKNLNAAAGDPTNSVFIGTRAGINIAAATVSNIISIGYEAVATASNTAVIGNANVTDVYLGSTSAAANIRADQGYFEGLKTTGSAGSKKVVCVDTATGQLYARSTGTDCSN